MSERPCGWFGFGPYGAQPRYFGGPTIFLRCCHIPLSDCGELRTFAGSTSKPQDVRNGSKAVVSSGPKYCLLCGREQTPIHAFSFVAVVVNCEPQRSINFLCRFLLHARQNMGVSVKRNGNCGVAQAFADDLRVHTLAKKLSRVRVAKVMEAEPC